MQMMSGRVLFFERNNNDEISLTNLRAGPGNHGRIARVFCVTHDSGKSYALSDRVHLIQALPSQQKPRMPDQHPG